ncbi:MAG TPA: YdbL family protein [Solimonas sp.]|nr:YdbL family protein [Solimonas sp.]
MTRWLRASLLTSGLALAACVTINVYFPAAAAEKAADRIIDDVWGNQNAPQQTPPPGPTSQLDAGRLLVAVLDALVPPAAAQEPNIDISSPEITHLKQQMETRFGELKPFLDSGAIGLSNDGDLATREVPLAQRTAVRNLIGNENSDRAALYREIATANKQPQWEKDIRAVFAQRWIAKAAPGWWYQDANGAWKQR